MTDSTKDYPCSRCSGNRRLACFSHVAGGVCFKCGGSGRQSTRPVVSVKWCVLDAGRHAYNINARTASEAISKARKTAAKVSRDLAEATAVPYDEYWTADRLAALYAAGTYRS